MPPSREWTAETALEMKESMLAAIEGWHPAARALVEGIEPDSMFMIPFGFLEPAESWEPSRVTIVGDAAHGMLPTLGMGANLSLNDAALLIDQIDRYAAGEVGLHGGGRRLRGGDARGHLPDPADDPRPRQQLRRWRAEGGHRADRRGADDP